MEKRLFIAVNLPAELKARLYSACLKILKPESFRLVKEENLHLTLKFLGYFPEEKIPGLCERLSVISGIPAFNARLECFGSFGENILWIGISEGCKRLEELNSKINELLELSEEKGFSCHLTIARSKNASSAEFKQALQSLQGIKISESFKVESVDLMQSELLPEGPKYSVVKTFRLS